MIERCCIVLLAGQSWKNKQIVEEFQITEAKAPSGRERKTAGIGQGHTTAGAEAEHHFGHDGVGHRGDAAGKRTMRPNGARGRRPRPQGFQRASRGRNLETARTQTAAATLLQLRIQVLDRTQPCPP